MAQSVQSMPLSLTLGVIVFMTIIGVIICQKVMSEISGSMKNATSAGSMGKQKKLKSESRKTERQKNAKRHNQRKYEKKVQ
eukprot:1773947-Amphidinium_carterae.3